MKIQRGIVKYKDRNDIVCTYALTDDGKQYYFLDETDTKKFSNGNRIASTALVEAIDPMVKAVNVGIIDQNGVVVVPFDNRSIRPVNDNVIVVEKAVPTTQSVVDAIDLRSDTTAAATLVSTAATIKDRLNAQMGVEGKYIFNDQFSEATICDINGTNLVNGEQYSFISLANDKLYLSKNTADSAISEFSLTTYELSTATTEAIDVASAGVDPQVVEGALASQTTVDVQDAVVPVDEELVTDPVDTVVSSEVTDNTPVDVSNVVGASETTDVVETVNAEPTTEGTENVEPTEEKKEDVIMSFIEPEDEGAKTDSTEVKEDVIMSFIEPEDGKSEGESTLNTVTTLSEGESVVDGIPYDNTVNNVEFSTENASPATEGEFSATDTSISDDLKAFANGAPSLGEEPASEEIKVEETTKDDTSSVPEDVSTTTTTTTDDAVVAITDDVVEEPTTETGDEEEEIPPIVEEEDKSSDDMPSVPVEEHDDEEAVDGAAPIVPLVEEEDDKSVQDDDVVEQTFSDTVKKLSDEEDDEKTLPEPVTIDAETVLATVDRNKNGIIDSDEIMVPQPKNTESPRDVLEPTPATTSLSDIFGTTMGESTTTRESYGYNSSPFTSNYSTTSSFGNDYSSVLTDVKPDRIGYDSYSSMSTGNDNIMADVARFMQELMRQNKEQKGVISQYQAKVESLESQARLLADKFKDQSIRYESLSGKLRTLDEATGRLESRNQMLEGRIREQETVIASQDRELKALRPQVEGKQDLVRLLADARTLLDSDSTGYGYNDDSYYGRRVA